MVLCKLVWLNHVCVWFNVIFFFFWGFYLFILWILLLTLYLWIGLWHLICRIHCPFGIPFTCSPWVLNGMMLVSSSWSNLWSFTLFFSTYFPRFDFYYGFGFLNMLQFLNTHFSTTWIKLPYKAQYFNKDI